MKYYCQGCKAEFNDKRKALPFQEMLKKSKGRTPCPNGCPDCGALIMPEHFTEEERALWFGRFSRCPNAKFCSGDRGYRPECEKLVFYPGCLTMLYYGLAEIKYAIEKVHGVDISAVRQAEAIAGIMKELDAQG